MQGGSLTSGYNIVYGDGTFVTEAKAQEYQVSARIRDEDTRVRGIRNISLTFALGATFTFATIAVIVIGARNESVGMILGGSMGCAVAVTSLIVFGPVTIAKYNARNAKNNELKFLAYANNVDVNARLRIFAEHPRLFSDLDRYYGILQKALEGRLKLDKAQWQALKKEDYASLKSRPNYLRFEILQALFTSKVIERENEQLRNDLVQELGADFSESSVDIPFKCIPLLPKLKTVSATPQSFDVLDAARDAFTNLRLDCTLMEAEPKENQLGELSRLTTLEVCALKSTHQLNLIVNRAVNLQTLTFTLPDELMGYNQDLMNFVDYHFKKPKMKKLTIKMSNDVGDFTHLIKKEMPEAAISGKNGQITIVLTKSQIIN